VRRLRRAAKDIVWAQFRAYCSWRSRALCLLLPVCSASASNLKRIYPLMEARLWHSYQNSALGTWRTRVALLNIICYHIL